jgi:hypothetical protein
LCSALLEEVADEVGFTGDALVIDREQFIHIVVAKLSSEPLAAKERRVANDHIRSRPLGFLRVVGVGTVQQGVLQPDRVERFEDRAG